MKQPLLRVQSRPELSNASKLKIRLLAFLLAIVAGGIFLLMIGMQPFAIYGSILGGALRSSIAIQGTVKLMIPLLICSLSVTLAFKLRFWNIGAEGQMIMGAVFASYFALFWGNLPHPLLMLLMFLAGAIGGAVWGLIPAYFKTRYGTNETLFTLMLNYIALNIIGILRDGPWRDPKSAGFPQIARFVKNVRIHKVLGVQAGWIVALVLLVLVFLYLKKTKQGYEVLVTGESEATARYAGMNVKRIILRTMLLSGAVAGIAGFLQAAGSDHTLAASVAGGVGFTAIIVAWLANLNPFGILLITFLFAVLEKGSSVMQSTYGLSTDSAAVLQGIILFFVLGCEFFTRYRIILRGGKEARNVD